MTPCQPDSWHETDNTCINWITQDYTQKTMRLPLPKEHACTWKSSFAAGIFGCLLVLAACDGGPPAPLPDDAKLPAPADLDRFEPEMLAAFSEAQMRVRQLPDAANWSNLGRVYHAHQQLENAISCYQAAMEAGDESNRTPHLLALALDETGNRQDAVESMVIASRQLPAYGPSFWRLGQWQLEAGDLDSAQVAMELAVQLGPEDAATLQAYGKYLIDTGRPSEAIKPLILLLSRQKNNSYARFLLGTALVQAGREKDGRPQLELGRGSKPMWADQHVTELSILTKGPRAEFLRLAAACDSGNPQGALPKLLQLEPRLGDDPNYHVQVAKAYRMLNRLDNANLSLQAALALEQEHVSANYQLAGLLRDRWHAQADKSDTTRLQEALAQADLIVSLNESLAAGHAVRGQILEDLGRVDESSRAFQQADVLDTEQSGFGYLAARVYMSNQQWANAAAILAKQCQRYPNDWALRRELGLVQWKAGQSAEATQTLLAIQPKFPDDQAVGRALQDLLNQ